MTVLARWQKNKYSKNIQKNENSLLFQRSMHVTDRRPPDGRRDNRHLDRHARSGLVRGHPVTVIRGARSFLFPKKIATQVGSSTTTTNQQTKLNQTIHPSQPTRLGKCMNPLRLFHCYPHDRPFHLVSRTHGWLLSMVLQKIVGRFSHLVCT